jgi:hypothetical protein
MKYKSGIKDMEKLKPCAGKMVLSLWKAVWQFLKKSETELPFLFHSKIEFVVYIKKM